MLIYIVNILLIGFYSLIYKYSLHKYKYALKILIGVITLQLIVLLSLKNHMIGADMIVYWDYFDKQLSQGLGYYNDAGFEYGHVILTKTVTNLSQNKQLYLFVISALATIPVGYIAYKYSKKPFLTMYLYVCLGFYAFTFSGLRQSIAIGLVLFSFRYLINSKFIKFVTIIVFASLFHFSALLFLPAYIIKNIKLTNSLALTLAIFSGAVFLLSRQIYTLFVNNVYETYAISQTDSYSWMLMCIVISILCIARYNKVVKLNKYYHTIYNLTIVGTILMLFSPIASNVLRVANYYYIFIILLIPAVLYTYRNSKFMTSLTAVVLVLSFGLYLYLLNVDGYNIVPYNFYWG